MMLTIDRWLTLVALVPLPFVSISVKVFGSAIHRRFETIQAQLSDISAVVQEALSGVRVVQGVRPGSIGAGALRLQNEETSGRNRGPIKDTGDVLPEHDAVPGIGALLVLWQGSREVI